MSKNIENVLVPTLRFPAFVNDGEWNEKPFEEFCLSISSGKDKNIIIGEYELYGSTGIIGKAENASYDGNFILIARVGANAGLLNKVKGRFGVTDNTLVIDLINKDLIDFIFYSLDNIGLNKLVFGSGQPLITGGQLKSLLLATPKSEIEQQKIAACLSSLDEGITAESQKLDVLKDHKKGLLQNLLPQEGETVPKFRFKEFEDSAEWEETTLTQVADYENGKAHEQDIADDGEFIVVNSKFISQDGGVKKFTNTALCPATKGDVLMVLSDIPNGKAIAKCFLVEEDNRYTVNQRICRITPRNLNSKILYYLLNRNPYFLAFDDGVKQTNLRKEDVLNCPLLIPSNPKEQDRIADALSSIDELINGQNQKLKSLQHHKKGLLQGLFPKLNEETE